MIHETKFDALARVRLGHYCRQAMQLLPASNATIAGKQCNYCRQAMQLLLATNGNYCRQAVATAAGNAMEIDLQKILFFFCTPFKGNTN